MEATYWSRRGRGLIWHEPLNGVPVLDMIVPFASEGRQSEIQFRAVWKREVPIQGVVSESIVEACGVEEKDRQQPAEQAYILPFHYHLIMPHIIDCFNQLGWEQHGKLFTIGPTNSSRWKRQAGTGNC